MGHKRAFYLCSSKPVSRNLDHIIDPSHYPEIAILVFACTVTGLVKSRELGEVLLNKSLVASIYCPHHPGPGLPYHKLPPFIDPCFGSIRFHYYRIYSRKRKRCRTGLKGCRSGKWSYQDAPGLGLPPCIHNRTSLVSDNIIVPHPGFGIYGLTYRSKKPQA